MLSDPRFLVAGNGGPFTLDGTRTYLVGRRRVAVIDPGPDLPDHVERVAEAVAGADSVAILLTHGHADHAGAAPALAARLSGQLGNAERSGDPQADERPRVHGPEGLEAVDAPMSDGAHIETDEGDLVALHTPGHTRDHLCFHWLERKALFAGDLLLGAGDTTWVAEYAGCVADYLASLERLRALDLEVVHPAHGPPLRDVPAALDRFEQHKRERIAQVERALGDRPDAGTDDLLAIVYGSGLPDAMRPAATRSLEALVEHVRVGGGRG